MFPIINKIKNVLFLLLPLFFYACKISEPLPLPTAAPVPLVFAEDQDSASAGAIKWRDFFTDPVLAGLIDTALQNNPDLLAAAQQVEVTRANYLFRKGLMLPQVEGIASAGVQKYGAYTPDGVGNFDTNFSSNINNKQHIPSPVPDFFVGLRSSWEVDLWGKLRSYRKAAYNRFLASQKGRQLITTALIAEVAYLYYDLLALHNELEILNQNIKLQEFAVELSRIQKEGGRTTELGVQQFTAQLLNTQSLKAIRQQEIVAAENELNQLLGRYPAPIIVGSNFRKQQISERIKAGVPSEMLRLRPDIQRAELMLKAAHADVEGARKAFLPSITISPFVGLNAFSASLLFEAPASIAYGLLGGLSAPLINRTRLKAELKRSEAEKLQAYFKYQKAIQNGFKEVVTNLKGIENYRKVARLKAEEVKVLQNAIGTSNHLYKAGYASYLEIITAQRNVLEAELSLIQNRKLMFHSMVGLYRSLGGGWQ